jgi:hypothetical protein
VKLLDDIALTTLLAASLKMQVLQPFETPVFTSRHGGFNNTEDLESSKVFVLYRGLNFDPLVDLPALWSLSSTELREWGDLIHQLLFQRLMLLCQFQGFTLLQRSKYVCT